MYYNLECIIVDCKCMRNSLEQVVYTSPLIFGTLRPRFKAFLIPWTDGPFAPLGPFLCPTTEENNGLLPQGKGPRLWVIALYWVNEFNIEKKFKIINFYRFMLIVWNVTKITHVTYYIQYILVINMILLKYNIRWWAYLNLYCVWMFSVQYTTNLLLKLCFEKLQSF